MNIISIEQLKSENSEVYRNFINTNLGEGNLKIRAFFANESLPISDLRIIVSTIIDNYKVIFFEGDTDSSGMIMNLSLPAPLINSDNLIVPLTTKYEIEANYMGNISKTFDVNIYDGICVVQNISLVPDKKRTDDYGS